MIDHDIPTCDVDVCEPRADVCPDDAVDALRDLETLRLYAQSRGLTFGAEETL